MADCQSSRVVGYARVSTTEQNTTAQVLAFKKAGVTEIVEERKSAVKNRPELDRLLLSLQRGDVLVVYKLDRLARSVAQCLRIFEDLKERGIGFRSLTESIETVTPHGRMFLQMLAAFAEFEREIIRERCRAGIRAAIESGKVFGRPPKYSLEDQNEIIQLIAGGGIPTQDIADAYGVSDSSARRWYHLSTGRYQKYKRLSMP